MRPFGVLAQPLLFATALMALAVWNPEIALDTPVYRYLFVLDITQSMNTRDYRLGGTPTDRLSFAKASIRRALDDLPCGSAVGLGLFTAQSVELLFEPLEVCRHRAIVEDVLDHVDWRMAWAADSHIAQGLYAAIRLTRKRGEDLRLVFFSDGQQTPEISAQPAFTGKPGEVQGFVVGTGGLHPVPIPKLDRDNRALGFWQSADLVAPLASTTYAGLPSLERTQPEPNAEIYLSWLHEKELKELSAATGLRYVRLERPKDLSRALRTPELGEVRRVPTGMGWVFAAGALLSLLWYHRISLTTSRSENP
ncbi:MAG TPA: vWA domain-containing protein [Methylococcus sp.]|nr:vWA domain-containing protein [Methylococcus sp.]